MADFQAMLQKFLQYAQQAPTGEGTQQMGLPPQMPPGIGSDFARGGGVGMPQNVPMPMARPNIPQGVPLPQARPPMPQMAQPQGGGLSGAGGAPMGATGVPMPQPRPPMMSQGPGGIGSDFAGAAMAQPQPQQPQPNFFQRSAMMQIDPNTGQPINPQAAAMAQALMQRPPSA